MDSAHRHFQIVILGHPSTFKFSCEIVLEFQEQFALTEVERVTRSNFRDK